MLPNTQWTALGLRAPPTAIKDVRGTRVAPGASVSATFKVTSGPAAFNGDLFAYASWSGPAHAAPPSEKAAEKVRNVSPIKINEFRISSPDNATNAFIELYNAGSRDTDISNWNMTEHPTQQALFSTVRIPAGTKLPAHGFYVLGLSTSGLAFPVSAGSTNVYVRSTTGLSVGDTVTIGTGVDAETRKSSHRDSGRQQYDIVAASSGRPGD